MSIQKAATILNVLQQNLAVLTTVLETDGKLTPTEFVQSMLDKQGWPAEEVTAIAPVLDYLVTAIRSP